MHSVGYNSSESLLIYFSLHKSWTHHPWDKIFVCRILTRASCQLSGPRLRQLVLKVTGSHHCPQNMPKKIICLDETAACEAFISQRDGQKEIFTRRISIHKLNATLCEGRRRHHDTRHWSCKYWFISLEVGLKVSFILTDDAWMCSQREQSQTTKLTVVGY